MTTPTAMIGSSGVASASAANDGTAGAAKMEGSSRRPKYSKFTQQELPACKPLLTPKWVIGTFFVIGVIFIPIGGIALAASSSVVEVGKRYDDECFRSLTAMAADPAEPDLTSSAARDAYIRNPATNKMCTINLTIPRTMSPPIFVYYQLDNFYQNHRRYVKSRSDVQLRSGDNVGINAKCKPKDCIQVNGSDNASCEPIVPCGLIAWSFFNDSYSLTLTSAGLDPSSSSSSSLDPGTNQTLEVTEKGIAWESDVNNKYGRVTPKNFNNDPATRGGSTLTGPINENEHFIVWMRTAALPSFRKLWGRLDRKLYAKSEISVTIVNQYNTYTFGGKKKLILSTGSWLGGANNFLGIAYLTVGALCMLSSFLFFLIHWRNPRPLGDTSYLSWNRKQEA